MNFTAFVSFVKSNIFLFVLLFFILILFIKNRRLSKKIIHLERDFFSFERNIDQKNNILENVTSRLTLGMPVNLNPEERERKLLHTVQDLINDFSIKFNRSIQTYLSSERDIWNNKFSVLLRTLGKTEKDLIENRDILFQDTWVSIAELNQKSQLLFQDMKEDGIFYRTQSLWLLGSLCLHQNRYVDAFRHFVAAMKLFYDGKPSLPLTVSIMWKIAFDFCNCSLHLDKKSQKDILSKFHLTPHDIVSLYQMLDNKDSHTELLQKIRIWYNNILAIN